MLLDLALSCRGRRQLPQLCLDAVVVSILALDCQGLPAAARSPPGEPSQGFLSLQELPPQVADEWAWSPSTQELVKSFVLMRHARCVTLGREWSAGPCVH
jgi:hypothetical protein